MKSLSDDPRSGDQVNGSILPKLKKNRDAIPCICPDFSDNLVPQLKNVFPEMLEDKSAALSSWSGYHRKSVKERQDELRIVFPQMDTTALNGGGLSINIADLMVENCIGIMGMPMGVSPNFVINDEHYVVPMCIEEPSVIAACSSVAKLVAGCGGFFASSTENIMIGQIQILEVPNPSESLQLIRSRTEELISHANYFCPSMRQRGGGVTEINARVMYPRTVTPGDGERRAYLVVHLHVDVCESMGANVVNTICEGAAPHIVSLVGGRVGLRILSNYCAERRARSSFRIPIDKLGWKGVSGGVVASRILEAHRFAVDDPFRAVTNNKGVMNGVDAVALATGQDWRAIEAGAHAYASRNGYYSPLSEFSIEDDPKFGQVFIGSLELPISVGTQGGAIRSHPTYRFAHDLLGNPSCRSLAQIIVSTGLAQNFAALRALAIEGIQKGHMALQARNIATAVGAPSDIVPEVVGYMISRKQINRKTARDYIDALMIWKQTLPPKRASPVAPSTLTVSVEPRTPKRHVPLFLNVAFSCLGGDPVHLTLRNDSKRHPLHDELFGSNRSTSWLSDVYEVLDYIKLTPKTAKRANLEFQSKLKLISILINVIVNELVLRYPEPTRTFLTCALKTTDRARCLQSIPTDSQVLLVGFPLVLSLWQVFEREVGQWVSPSNSLLAEALLQEQRQIILSINERVDLKTNLVRDSSLNINKEEFIESFMSIHRKRWQATMMLLCDALTMSPVLLTEERLLFIQKLGELFEYEGTVAHDISRHARNKDNKVPNVLNTWLSFDVSRSKEEVFW
eukprot:398430_1